ncbi:MAG: outer membrane lipoprotein carrier protein LolA [Deltaproteobacteria bacterium]|nr:outer membrane lipoprotein carrier protein LolA [Deltaproteobacteria bacterium]
MKYSALLWFLSLTAIFPPALSGAAPTGASLDKVLATLERPFQTAGGKGAAIQDFQVDFLQESEIASLGRKQLARGRAAFKFLAPSQKKLVSPLFSWEYLEPHRQQIVSDGATVWFHVPENQQAIRSEAGRSLTGDERSNPLLFLTRIGELRRFFEIGWAAPRRDESGDYRLTLTPREPSPLVRSLLFVVSQQAVASKTSKLIFPLRAVVLVNVNGDRSRIDFSSPRINQGLSNENFRFAPPEGTDILTPEQFSRAFQGNPK